MNHRSLVYVVSVILLTFLGCSVQQNLTDEQLHARADKLAHQFIIIDTHIDLPSRLADSLEDISQRTGKDFDYVRARQGGLDASFMSIYTSASEEADGTARAKAEKQIDIVATIIKSWPDKFAPAYSPADVTANFAKGRMSLPMGMENGAPIEGKLDRVQYFYNRGIRYITLCHARDNHISDSSFDTTRTWHGLSPFGRQVVSEMNRLGIMIDVSHISDDAFYQVMQFSSAPVIASHSSCRAFVPWLERDISDDMIKRLAKNGGVLMINFASSFLSKEYRLAEMKMNETVRAYMTEKGLKRRDPVVDAFTTQYKKDHPMPYADVSDVAKHIDHVVNLVGVDYVGIGSDFEGVGDELPTGLKDVSMYPHLIYEFLKLGYSDSQIKKICGENLLRVWQQVENNAHSAG
jgi:membrane dipeptidase